MLNVTKSVKQEPKQEIIDIADTPTSTDDDIMEDVKPEQSSSDQPTNAIKAQTKPTNINQTIKQEEDDDDNMSVDEQDDPIVKKFDVFLAQNLTDSLYVLQYPLRPPSRFEFCIHP